ncbi:hypothetical protein COCON_G00165170 [Conger conger]|uniref:UBC core domain-containing protein n=1 Tax=Conger conger TaxID=82655 RepID=A0A9Q1HT59_CONCO|nr:hypothetical protein COCON_G00165170 [Conger conger]
MKLISPNANISLPSFKNGDVCISILHPPVDDPQSGELPSERWNPTQNVRTILLSVISLLNEPNTFSPANVDASVMFRKWRDSKGKDKEYAEIIRKQVLSTKADADRDGVKVPTTLAEYCIQTKVPSHDSSSDLLYDDLYDDDIEEEEEDEEDAEAGGGVGGDTADCYDDEEDSGNEDLTASQSHRCLGRGAEPQHANAIREGTPAPSSPPPPSLPHLRIYALQCILGRRGTGSPTLDSAKAEPLAQKVLGLQSEPSSLLFLSSSRLLLREIHTDFEKSAASHTFVDQVEVLERDEQGQCSWAASRNRCASLRVPCISLYLAREQASSSPAQRYWLRKPSTSRSCPASSPASSRVSRSAVLEQDYKTLSLEIYLVLAVRGLEEKNEPQNGEEAPASYFIGKKEDVMKAKRVSKFINGRDVLVIYYEGKFYAMDAYCYHAGGLLENGDIEYKITLAEGEGLYQASDPEEKPPIPRWYSKGIKQRVHTVLDVGGDIYVKMSDVRKSIGSDYYQTEKQRQERQKCPEISAAADDDEGEPPPISPTSCCPTHPPAHRAPPLLAYSPPRPHPLAYSPPPPHALAYSQSPPHTLAYSPPPPHTLAYSPPPPHTLAYSPPPPHALAYSPPPPHTLGYSPPPPHALAYTLPPPHTLAYSPPPPHALAYTLPPPHTLAYSPPPPHALAYSQSPPHTLAYSQSPPHTLAYSQSPPHPWPTQRPHLTPLLTWSIHIVALGSERSGLGLLEEGAGQPQGGLLWSYLGRSVVPGARDALNRADGTMLSSTAATRHPMNPAFIEYQARMFGDVRVLVHDCPSWDLLDRDWVATRSVLEQADILVIKYSVNDKLTFQLVRDTYSPRIRPLLRHWAVPVIVAAVGARLNGQHPGSDGVSRDVLRDEEQTWVKYVAVLDANTFLCLIGAIEPTKRTRTWGLGSANLTTGEQGEARERGSASGAGRPKITWPARTPGSRRQIFAPARKAPLAPAPSLSRDLGATYLEVPSLNDFFVGRYFGGVLEYFMVQCLKQKAKERPDKRRTHKASELRPPQLEQPARLPAVRVEESRFSQDMQWLLERGVQFADVAFYAGDSGKELGWAHAAVLCSVSPYFRQLLLGGQARERPVSRCVCRDAPQSLLSTWDGAAEDPPRPDGHLAGRLSRLVVKDPLLCRCLWDMLRFLYRDQMSCCILDKLEGSDGGRWEASQEGIAVVQAGQNHRLDQELGRVGDVSCSPYPRLRCVARSERAAEMAQRGRVLGTLSASEWKQLQDAAGEKLKSSLAVGELLERVRSFLTKEKGSRDTLNSHQSQQSSRYLGNLFNSPLAVLVARCDVMAAMFSGKYAEARSRVVPIHGVSSDTFLSFLEYLYTDTCCPASVLQAMAVLVCAEMYQVKRLQHLCEVCVCAYLQSMPSRELASTGISVVRLLRRAKCHNADQLYVWLLHFIANNYLIFSHKPDFLELSDEEREQVERVRWPSRGYLQELSEYQQRRRQLRKSRCLVIREGIPQAGSSRAEGSVAHGAELGLVRTEAVGVGRAKDPSSAVLDILEPQEALARDPDEKCVTVIQPGGDKGVDKFFCIWEVWMMEMVTAELQRGRVKRTGPRTDPWGTPQVTGWDRDFFPPKETYSVLSESAMGGAEARLELLCNVMELEMVLELCSYHFFQDLGKEREVGNWKHGSAHRCIQGVLRQCEEQLPNTGGCVSSTRGPQTGLLIGPTNDTTSRSHEQYPTRRCLGDELKYSERPGALGRVLDSHRAARNPTRLRSLNAHADLPALKAFRLTCNRPKRTRHTCGGTAARSKAGLPARQHLTRTLDDRSGLCVKEQMRADGDPVSVSKSQGGVLCRSNAAIRRLMWASLLWSDPGRYHGDPARYHGDPGRTLCSLVPGWSCLHWESSRVKWRVTFSTRACREQYSPYSALKSFRNFPALQSSCLVQMNHHEDQKAGIVPTEGGDGKPPPCRREERSAEVQQVHCNLWILAFGGWGLSSLCLRFLDLFLGFLPPPRAPCSRAGLGVRVELRDWSTRELWASTGRAWVPQPSGVLGERELSGSGGLDAGTWGAGGGLDTGRWGAGRGGLSSLEGAWLSLGGGVVGARPMWEILDFLGIRGSMKSLIS